MASQRPDTSTARAAKAIDLGALKQINRYETNFLYKEIFSDGAYRRHGLAYPDDAIIFDVGANIGLFSLYSLQQCPNPRIFAFEPAPHCVDCFKANLAHAGDRVRLFEMALVDRPGEVNFTYYPHYSILSGVLADPAADLDTLRRGAAAQLGEVGEEADRMVDMLVGGKTSDAISFACPGMTISQIVQAHDVPRIDLLKIDVEKAERMVLAGVDDGDWHRIRQVVVEVHDLGQAEHEQTAADLRARGFRVTIDNSEDLSQSEIYNLYAVRD